MRPLTALTVLTLTTSVACGGATSPTPVTTPTPAGVDRIAIESVEILGASPGADGIYRLSRDGSYTLEVRFHNPRISGRQLMTRMKVSWKEVGYSHGPESTGGNGLGFVWAGAPAGNQSITIQLEESGGDLPEPYKLERVVNIVFS